MNKRRFFFLSFLFVLVVWPLGVFTVFGNAESTGTIEKGTITGSNFSLELEGLPDYIHPSVGHANIESIEQINSISVNDTVKILNSRAYVRIKVVLWTEVLPSEAVLATSKKQTATWLTLITADDETWKTNLATNSYTAEYDTYVYSSTSSSSSPSTGSLWAGLSGGLFSSLIKPLQTISEGKPILSTAGQGFTGTIIFNAQAQSLIPKMIDFENEQVKISGTEFTSSLNEIVIQSANVAKIAEYTTIVNQIGETKLTTLDVPISQAAARAEAGESSAALQSYIADSDLGIRRLPIKNSTLGLGANSPPSVGAVVTDGLYTRLIPEVELIIEPLEIRSQTIGVDTKTGALGVSKSRIISSWCSAVETKTVDRCIGWKIQNYAIEFDLRLEFNLFSKYTITQLKSPKNPSLRVPDVQINDYIINSMLTGQTGVDIVVQSEDPVAAWFSDVWENYWYIIILVGIVIVIVLGVALFSYFNTISGGALGAAAGNALRSKVTKHD